MTKPKQPSWSEEFEKVWNKYPMGIIVEEDIKDFISQLLTRKEKEIELKYARRTKNKKTMEKS